MEDFKIEVSRGEEIDYRKLGKLLYRGFSLLKKIKNLLLLTNFLML